MTRRTRSTLKSLRVVRRHRRRRLRRRAQPGRRLSGGRIARREDSPARLRSGEVRPFARGHDSRRPRYGVHARRPDARLVGLRRPGDRLGRRRGEVSEELLAHRGPVWALAVSHDGRTLYSAGNDGRLILWDLAGDRRLVRPFSLREPFQEIQTPRGIAVSPDGGTLAYTHGDGTVDLVRYRDAPAQAKLPGDARLRRRGCLQLRWPPARSGRGGRAASPFGMPGR